MHNITVLNEVIVKFALSRNQQNKEQSDIYHCLGISMWKKRDSDHLRNV